MTTVLPLVEVPVFLILIQLQTSSGGLLVSFKPHLDDLA